MSTIIGCAARTIRNILHLLYLRKGPDSHLPSAQWVANVEWATGKPAMASEQAPLLCAVPLATKQKAAGAGGGQTEERERMAWNPMQLLNFLFINFKLYQFLDFWIPTGRRKKEEKDNLSAFNLTRIEQ